MYQTAPIEAVSEIRITQAESNEKFQRQTPLLIKHVLDLKFLTN